MIVFLYISEASFSIQLYTLFTIFMSYKRHSTVSIFLQSLVFLYETFFITLSMCLATNNNTVQSGVIIIS